MNKWLIFIATLLLSVPAFPTVGVTANAVSPYKNQVMPGVPRTPGFTITGGTNNTLNYTLSGTTTGVTLHCTSACAPEVTVDMPTTAPSCAMNLVPGVGHYTVTGGQVFTLTGTSTDDPTKSATTVFQVCDTISNAFVNVEPKYDQAFQGQDKTLQSYVVGYANENVTWAITSGPASFDGSLSDTTNRDTVFHSGTKTGAYTFTATSVANGSIAGTAVIWVSANTLPRTTQPNKTVPIECDASDPRFTTDLEIGVGKTYTTLLAAPTTSMGAGTIVRITNSGANGSPTIFHEAMTVGGTGTAAAPIRVCGVPNASGELPVIAGDNSTESAASSGLSGRGGIRLFNCNPTGTGYGLGSCGPDYISITGIRFQKWNQGYTYYPLGNMSNPTVWSGGNVPACIWSRSGQHLLIEGVDMDDCDWGVLANNNTQPTSPFANSSTGQTWADWQQFMGSHINNFSHAGNFSTHGLYLQGGHIIIEGNLIENPQMDCSGIPLVGCNLDEGNFIKARGSASIIRYNLLRGTIGGQVIAFPDMADSYPYTSVDQWLGLPGDTACIDSVACSNTSNPPLIEQLLENQQALMEDFTYGNVLADSAGIAGFPEIGIGSYAAFNIGASGHGSECQGSDSGTGTMALCTPNMDHNGTYYFFSNTVDQPINGVFQTANNSTSAIIATAQYFATTLWIQNNIIWNDVGHNQPPSNPFIVNLDATHVATYLTNLFQSTLVTTSGTISGNCTSPTQGWGCWSNGFAFSPSDPIKTITGLGGTNFLTTSTMPYNRASYAPSPSSAAVGACSTVTNAVIAHMPVRYQPDPVNGYMVARSFPCDLGAVDHNASQPTISSIAITPPNYTLSSGGTTLYYTAKTTFSNGVTEDSTLRGTWGPASGAILFNFYVQRNIFGTVGTGSENATLTLDSTTQGSLLTIGTPPATVVSIAVTPPTASIIVGGTQNFVCTATMSSGPPQTCSSQGTVTWISSVPATASINSSGVALGAGVGSTTITATFSGVSPATATLNVSAIPTYTRFYSGHVIVSGQTK